MDDPATVPRAPLGLPLPHDSATLHVTGEALYVDDLPELPGLLHAVLALSPEAHAEILALDLDPALTLLGDNGLAVTARDIPGINDVGPMSGPEPILADGIVAYVGQPIAAGTLLGRVIDLYSYAVLEEIVAPFDGFLFFSRYSGTVSAGTQAFALAEAAKSEQLD
jgi:xanthine dehydrogenase molybdopterin-binding subunit B